jgi:hypothetical protein
MAVFRKLKQSTLWSSDRLAFDTRPGHLSFNPSEWRFQIRILVLALGGFCIAIYLAFYQWGIVKTVWEPFFKNGSERALNSFVSRLLPVPDAFLGALGYLADLTTGLIEGSTRWRTMPRMVLVYGFTVCLVCATAVGLTLLQPLFFRAGCTLCLASTLISICIVWLARHEVWASFHHIRDCRELSPLFPDRIT